MITIDLEENDDDVVLVLDKSEEPQKNSNALQFKRKLISKVRKYRFLYDNKHKLFPNVAKKDLVWQQIANKLKSDVDVCKETWFDLRYNYQRHARKLRKFFVEGHKKNLKRPTMALEQELMFLWRVIDNRKTCEVEFEIPEEESTQAETDNKTSSARKTTTTQTYIKPIDDDLILVESPVELIVIDEDDDVGKSDKQFKLNSTMKNLIALIKSHPELYDSKHKDFHNYTKKSFVWNAIASNIGDKATKLMKCWIVMQTRYEWEICHGKHTADYKAESELQVEFKFLKDFILENPFTVYKQSYFLKSAWYDPIDYFKDIYNLIVRMKKMSDIVYVTDALLKTPEKSLQYLSLWTDISNLKNSSPGQCETTWLIMRHFYWELMNMRQENYQLTDKWYFETIITELYAISRAAKARNELEVTRVNKQNKKASKRPAQTNATSEGAPANKRSSPISIPVSTATQITPTIINNFQNIPPTSSSLTTQSAVQPQLVLPKITAAISLAPQALSSGPLQIKQISGPPSLSPAPFQLNNGPNTTVAPPTSAVSTQMTTMSFNLPTQTKVTPISLPTLIRPVQNNTQPIVRNTSTATISVRPQSQLKPSQPQIQIASWATAPRAAVNSTNVVTQIHNYLHPIKKNSYATTENQPSLQPPTTAPPGLTIPNLAPLMPYNTQTSQFQSGINQQNALAPFANSVQSIAPFKVTTLPSSTTISPSTSCSIAPAILTSTSCSITPSVNNNSNTSKFTMAPAEPIKLPTRSSNNNNNNNTQLPKITGAISLLNPNEILIELIASHKGNHLLVHGPPLSAKYQLTMEMIAKFIREVLAIPMLHSKQNVQMNLINLFWDHISHTFNLPVHICRAIWNFLLENFDHFPKITRMTELMKPFQTTLKVWNESNKLFRKFDEMSTSNDWLKYSKSFPDVVDCISGYPALYQDVAKEKNPENEVEMLCAWRTICLRFPENSNIKEIWTALKTYFVKYMNDLEVGIVNKWSIFWWRSLARMKFLVEAKYAKNEPYYYIISNKMLEEIDQFATMEMRNRKKPEEATITADNTNSNVEMEIMATFISSEEKNKKVEVGALLAAIQKYPIIFTKAGYIEKCEAWEKVANELEMDVPSCLLAFKTATEKYLAYKKRDPFNRLHINEKYYKKFDEIVYSLPFSKFSTACRAKINVKTPFELNQSVDTDNSADLLFPERFISDINMSNCSSDLVVKNWIYAIGNIPNFSESATFKIAEVLKKYLPNAKL